MINGQKQEVPAQIGIDRSCLHFLHTTTIPEPSMWSRHSDGLPFVRLFRGMGQGVHKGTDTGLKSGRTAPR